MSNVAELNIQRVKQRLRDAKALLRRCYPYVKAHFERSAAGFGEGARKLMAEIEKLVDSDE